MKLTELIEEPGKINKLVKGCRGDYWLRPQADLANELGVTVMTISRLENHNLSKQAVVIMKVIQHLVNSGVLEVKKEKPPNA